MVFLLGLLLADGVGVGGGGVGGGGRGLVGAGDAGGDGVAGATVAGGFHGGDGAGAGAAIARTFDRYGGGGGLETEFGRFAKTVPLGVGGGGGGGGGGFGLQVTRGGTGPEEVLSVLGDRVDDWGIAGVCWREVVLLVGSVAEALPGGRSIGLHWTVNRGRRQLSEAILVIGWGERHC